MKTAYEKAVELIHELEQVRDLKFQVNVICEEFLAGNSPILIYIPGLENKKLKAKFAKAVTEFLEQASPDQSILQEIFQNHLSDEVEKAKVEAQDERDSIVVPEPQDMYGVCEEAKGVCEEAINILEKMPSRKQSLWELLKVYLRIH